MLKEFNSFIIKEKLFNKEDKVLLAVSGGIDSVVMCDLFYKSKFCFDIAHCNFNLRGEESDTDQQFVIELAKKYGVIIHHKKFNTDSHSKKKGISIQMAARDLRYEWFNTLLKEKKYKCIAIAHHLDDSIETFFINILRGTGIAGLQGIAVKQGNIIRPLLFANKKMIQDYVEENKLIWREDASNLTDKYIRNNIRHNIIPSLKKLNKGFEKTILKELSYFKDAADIFKKFIEEKKKEIVIDNGKDILLNIQKLKESEYAKTILHEVLRTYDFTPETTELIAKRMYTTAGKKFLSPTYRLIKDRDFFILSPLTSLLKTNDKEIFLLNEGDKEFSNEILHLKIEIMKGTLSDVKDKSKLVAYLDYAKLDFPLIIRKWKKGDSFYPLGMKGKKKLSDFFIDSKISVNDKENTWVLESDQKIAWIVGHRIDNRFKIKPSTKRIYKAILDIKDM